MTQTREFSNWSRPGSTYDRPSTRQELLDFLTCLPEGLYRFTLTTVEPTPSDGVGEIRLIIRTSVARAPYAKVLKHLVATCSESMTNPRSNVAFSTASPDKET